MRHLIAVTVCIAVTTKQLVQLLDGPQHQHTHQHVGPAGCHDLHGIQLVFRDSASPTNRLNLVGGCNQDFGIIRWADWFAWMHGALHKWVELVYSCEHPVLLQHAVSARVSVHCTYCGFD